MWIVALVSRAFGLTAAIILYRSVADEKVDDLSIAPDCGHSALGPASTVAVAIS
jgi:hypothetical protein